MRLLSLLFTVACIAVPPDADKSLDTVTDTGTGGLSDPLDEDGDGVSVDDGDCDDHDASVGLPSDELCDGIDNNCDGAVDEGLTTPYYADADADGFGDAADWLAACEPPAGRVQNDEDCDDANASVYPGNVEFCNGADDDCDGQIDNDAEGTAIWYADGDGDGFGDIRDALETCETPAGRVRDATDCDDTHNAVNPAATELCNTIDDDCDGLIDEDDAADATIWYVDADGDAYGSDAGLATACLQPTGYSAYNSDCDDTDAAYYPGASEADCADPNDYNCDGSVAYADVDGDGWAACSECDDGNATTFPGATEVCDGADNDCDGTIDEADATDAKVWYTDADADGFGDLSTALVACDRPVGYVSDSADCDDALASTNPAATEFCNGIDDDCDAEIDEPEAADAAVWYADADGDSYGDPAVTTVACDAPAGFVADATDCNDARLLIHPGATEYCNTDDDDCDGDVDEDAADSLSYWLDDDGDGYGDPAISDEACSSPPGYVRDDDDCDDSNAAISPSGVETCNEVDDDCDGTADDGITTGTWFADDDGDGFGGATVTGCEEPPASADNTWDCDDTNAAIYPGSDVSCPWPSCLDLLVDDIATSDGSYWIDFDGVATETECDMTTDGGGWTLVYDEDFESAADPGWNVTSRYACAPWSTLLGGYGIMSGGSLTQTMSTYAITHTEAWIEVEYAKLDSWDGETASVTLDGASVWSSRLYYYQGSEVCGWNRGWSGSYDELHSVSAMVAHTTGSVAFAATSTLDQVATDESFGIDNLYLWLR